MIKTMLEFLSVGRAGLLLAGVLLAACGGNDEPPPDTTEPGPSSGSTCPSDSTLTYENFGMQFFENYCTRCHSTMPENGTRSGAPRGLDWDQIDIGVRWSPSGETSVNGSPAARPDFDERAKKPRSERRS